jgi:hypothetical protein
MLLVLWITQSVNAQQRQAPMQYHLHRKLIHLSHQMGAESDSNAIIHSGLRPILRKDLPNGSMEKVLEDSIVIYYDIQNFAFKRHLLRVNKDDYFIAADPEFIFQLGNDIHWENSLDGVKWPTVNTRGFRVQGDIGKKVSFETYFYENQAFFVTYLDDYIRSRGELYYGGNNYYFRSNGVVPGQGRTKEFKDFGYDYAMAGGYVSFSPVSWMNFQFGHDKHFLGYGYRSMALSDNSFNYPYARADFTLPGKLKYSYVHAWLNELRRLPARTTPEALYFRKEAAYMVLSWQPVRNLEIAIFEGVQFQTMDINGSLPFNYLTVIPIMGATSALRGFNKPDNALLGIQAQYFVTKNERVYAQFVADDPGDGRISFQAGASSVRPLKKDLLSLSAEFNYAAPYTYATNIARQGVNHYNLPLAHPLGAGFSEFIIQGHYEHHKHVFAEAQLQFYSVRVDTGNVSGGSDPLKSYDGTRMNDYFASTAISLKIEAGYKLNARTNMQLLLGMMYRNQSLPGTTSLTHHFYVAWRTNLRNIYYDI